MRPLENKEMRDLLSKFWLFYRKFPAPVLKKDISNLRDKFDDLNENFEGWLNKTFSEETIIIKDRKYIKDICNRTEYVSEEEFFDMKISEDDRVNRVLSQLKSYGIFKFDNDIDTIRLFEGGFNTIEIRMWRHTSRVSIESFKKNFSKIEAASEAIREMTQFLK